MTTRITHWIDGKPFGGSTERSGDVYDPATGQVTGKVDFADVATVDQAVASAATAAEAWGRASLSVRSRVLFRFRELLDARKEEVAAVITAQHGEGLSDARGEGTRGPEGVGVPLGVPPPLTGGF